MNAVAERDVARALLELARANDARSIAVVGTGKNVGKSVVVAALAQALGREAKPFGLCSIGRDGESVDAITATAKPRFFLRPGAVVATARALLPASPAIEYLRATTDVSAAGPIVLGRVRAPSFFEIAGPPNAAALRRIVHALQNYADEVLIDGAVDRLAALRDGDDAIVVAVGAANAPTLGRAVDDAAGLVARLRLPLYDGAADAVEVDGPLTARGGVELATTAAGRPIVVRDPTAVVFGGREFLTLRERLDIHVRRVLRPIACTVAPIGPERRFEPAAFARAVAAATGLPTFDIFAGIAA